MRRYELMVIVDGELDDTRAREVVEQVADLITAQGGTIVDREYWGRRPFTYEIRHRTHGYYAVFDLEIGLDGLAEVERQLKLRDEVMRHKVVRFDVRTHRRRRTA